MGVGAATPRAARFAPKVVNPGGTLRVLMLDGSELEWQPPTPLASPHAVAPGPVVDVMVCPVPLPPTPREILSHFRTSLKPVTESGTELLTPWARGSLIKGGL